MTTMLTKTNKAKDQLLHDLQSLVTDAQEICSALTQDTKATARNLGRSVQEKKAVLQAGAVKKVKAADRVVRDNPYRTAGIAFAIGLVLTCFIKRR
jgi:ElaB/YqjD/DUF883 family membrane-anchored ribosome-binding protein